MKTTTSKYPLANKCHILNRWVNKHSLFIFIKESTGANVLLVTDAAEYLNSKSNWTIARVVRNSIEFYQFITLKMQPMLLPCIVYKCSLVFTGYSNS
jgi:hypothetical protein